MRKGDGLRRHEADDEPAVETRPSGRGDGGQSWKADAGFGHGGGNDFVKTFDMSARRDLRHYAAIGPVLLPLRAHDIREDFAFAGGVADHDCGRSLVAARLDAEDERISRRRG